MKIDKQQTREYASVGFKVSTMIRYTQTKGKQEECRERKKSKKSVEKMVIWWNKSVQINISCDGIFLSTFPLWEIEKNDEEWLINFSTNYCV